MRRTPLKRTPFKHRTRRSPQENAGRALVERRSGEWCEVRIDGECTGAAKDWQHRRNRSQGGTWAASNGLHCCRPCHLFIHHHPKLAMDNGWTVKASDNWRTVPVLLFDGFVILGDDGQRYDPPHKRRCAVWTSIDPCDCEETT